MPPGSIPKAGVWPSSIADAAYPKQCGADSTTRVSTQPLYKTNLHLREVAAGSTAYSYRTISVNPNLHTLLLAPALTL